MLYLEFANVRPGLWNGVRSHSSCRPAESDSGACYSDEVLSGEGGKKMH